MRDVAASATVAVLLLVLIVAIGRMPAAAQPDAHLAKLDYHALMGTWACAGSDDRRRALTATIAWGFNDGGGFYFTIAPKPKSTTHAAVSELWEFDESGGVWRAIPDAGSADAAQFVSGGWSGKTLTWVRMAAESTMDRTFVRTGTNQLTFRSERGIVQTGDGAPRKHIFYHLACRRIVNDAPR